MKRPAEWAKAKAWSLGWGATALATLAAVPALAQQAPGLRGTFPPPPILLLPGQRNVLGGDPLNDAAALLRRPGEQPQPAPEYTPETESEAALESERIDDFLGAPRGNAETDNAQGGGRPSRDEADPSATGGRPADDGIVDASLTGETASKDQSRITTPGATGTARPGGTRTDRRTTGSVTARTGQTENMVRVGRALPVGAVQSRTVADVEDPFEAVGLRFGAITLRPTLEQGVEHVTTRGATGSRGTTASITTLRGEIESDWRRGSLTGNGFVTLRQPLSGDGDLSPEAGLSATLTNPLGRDWQTEAGFTWSLKEEDAASAVPITGSVAERPEANSFIVSGGVSRIDGFLRPGFRVEIDRDTFGDAVLDNGTVLTQSDRDETAVRGTARLGFAVSPALIPFIEAGYGLRMRDEKLDAAGFDQSGDELRGAVGLAFNPGEKINGEVSVGWIRQGFDDARLDSLDALALAGTLNWSPQRGTTVRANLTTTTDGGRGADGGSVLYAGTLGVTHQFNSRLTGTATLGASLRDFDRTGQTDTTLSAEAVATWWWNRYVGMDAKARYETVSSPDPARETDTTTLFLGLKFQR
ncbi:MAG: outer membrane beta-barrel protein [Rhizobiaceae bacterium]|nr:outer membrane beta-barrel protein [Rhizobiaceae bacterium]